MDQLKIGRFIAECRKKQGFTQASLAEKLGITDRAVSKWETGKSLPDASIMLDLCSELSITVNDLLSGEVVSMDDYKEKYEQNLIKMKKDKEATDKHLLKLEVLIGVICVAFMLAFVVVASYVQMEEWLRIVLVCVGLLPLMIATPYMLRIEQKAGYYHCEECGNRYVPAFKSVIFAQHKGRTRYMRCPRCGKKSWQKKVICKD